MGSGGLGGVKRVKIQFPTAPAIDFYYPPTKFHEKVVRISLCLSHPIPPRPFPLPQPQLPNCSKIKFIRSKTANKSIGAVE